MVCAEYSFESTDISVTSAEVGSWIGYPNNKIPHAIKEKIDDTLAELLGIVDLKGGFGVKDGIIIEPKSVLIEGKEFQTKKIIARSLKKATSVAIFTCTVGEDVSKWASQSLKEDVVAGYIADVSASVMAEKVAEKVQKEIEKLAQSQAENISNRYSPGYCGWSVSDQHLLFSFLPNNFCGITLNEAALMHPIKSVSGIIGIGKEIVKNPYQCNICDITDCIMSPATKSI
jgi:hypothetical protein